MTCMIMIIKVIRVLLAATEDQPLATSGIFVLNYLSTNLKM